MNVATLPTAKQENTNGPHRSAAGNGDACYIYVLGQANEYADSIVPSYGKITAGCGPNLGEDYASTIWPVVVKIKPAVTEGNLIQHLRDLADLIEQHTTEEARQRPHAERGCPECGLPWLRPDGKIHNDAVCMVCGRTM